MVLKIARPFRVGFCVSGGGRLFRAAAIHAEALGIEAALVVAEHKAADDLTPFCTNHGIALVRVGNTSREIFNAEVTRVCAEAELDLLCLTFDRIIPPSLVRHYPERIINVHPGLLPAFKGMRPLERAVDSNTRFVGATIHEVDEDVDTGPIIAQCVLGVRPSDTPALLGQRMFGTLRLMYLQVIQWYAAGRVEKDSHGRIWVRDAVYGELPVSPAIEQAFSD